MRSTAGPAALLREDLCCQKTLGVVEDGGIILLLEGSVCLSED